MQSGLSELLERAESQHDTALGFVDDIHTRERPDGCDHHDCAREKARAQRRIARASAATATPTAAMMLNCHA